MQRAPINRFFQLAGCILACSAGFATAETICLGGPRDIVVDIDDVQEGFSVVVEMRPVACFDKATNARINRSKACLYGLAGLEKSLAIETGRLAALRNVIGMNVEEVTPAADRYRLRFFVPETELHREETAVLAEELHHAADESSLEAPPRSELFTCVRDYEMTFEELKRSFCERVDDAVEAASKAASRDTIAEFAGEARRTLAVIDSDAKRAFTAAEKDFTEDLRVLTMEKNSLSKSLASAAANFEAAKAAAYSALELLEIRIQKQPSPASPAKDAIESVSPK
jgi:hypothetical protein